MKTQRQPITLPEHNPNPLEAAPASYEAAKAERSAFITDWLSEHLLADKKPACSGWPKTALLLVINNTAVTLEEREVEKLAVSTYTNEECLQRVKHWQEMIKQRQSGRCERVEDLHQQLRKVMTTIGFLTIDSEEANKDELAELKTIGSALQKRIENWDWQFKLQA